MNLDKFEKINGREALRRLVDGEEIFTGKGSKMRLDFENHQMVNGYGGVVSFYPLHAVLSGNWYIPKPFNVRQAMLDHPNEWVGAFQTGLGVWYKVGFDTVTMQAVEATTHSELAPIYAPSVGIKPLRVNALDACIPLEDVPEEATR